MTQLLLLLVLILLVVMTAGISQVPDRLGEEFPGDGEHSDYEGLVAEGPPISNRVRRSRHRSTSASSTQRPMSSGNFSIKEAKRRFRVDSIKDEILRKLRMDSAPNITTTTRQHELHSMEQFFNQYQHETYPTPTDQITDDDYSTPLAFIVLSHTVPRPHLNASNSCYFKFLSPSYRPNQIVTAQLGVYLRSRYGQLPPTDDSVRHLLLRRNQRRQQHQQQSGDSYRSKVINASNPHHFGRWHFFDVKTLVQAWITRPERNTGITFTSNDASLQSLVLVQPRRTDEEPLRPFIEVRIRPSSEVRVTRSTGPDCSEDSQERRCCRYPLTIDFNVFRWDWIIAPKRYDAYYCSGDCPFLYYQTNIHSHLSQQISPRAAPCCAPTQLSPLPIIYMDDKIKRIVYGSIPGMIVDRCGCS